MDINEVFGKKVLERRLSLKISQETLANMADIDRTYLPDIVHIPADTRSAFPVISVQSPVSIQCCWQS